MDPFDVDESETLDDEFLDLDTHPLAESLNSLAYSLRQCIRQFAEWAAGDPSGDERPLEVCEDQIAAPRTLAYEAIVVRKQVSYFYASGAVGTPPKATLTVLGQLIRTLEGMAGDWHRKDWSEQGVEEQARKVRGIAVYLQAEFVRLEPLVLEVERCASEFDVFMNLGLRYGATGNERDLAVGTSRVEDTRTYTWSELAHKLVESGNDWNYKAARMRVDRAFGKGGKSESPIPSAVAEEWVSAQPPKRRYGGSRGGDEEHFKVGD